MASRFQDIKEQITDQLVNQWNRFTESTLYIQSREKYEDLSSTKQKIVLVVGSIVIFLLIFSVPYSYFTAASAEIERFESVRQLTRDLLRVTRTQDAPPVENISASLLIGRIQDELKVFRLTKEQIAKVEPVSVAQMANLRVAPPQIEEEAVQLVLAQLNLKQIIDIGHRMANLGETLKLSAMTIQATKNKPGYFDAIMQVSTFSAVLPKADSGPKDKRNSRRRGGDE